MKAAVCYEFGKPLVVEEIELDDTIHEGEVKVRLAATAICHSDIHAVRGELPGKLPMVPGHEAAGYVEAVGKSVTSLKPGDPVLISHLASCGQCHYCLRGLPHLCETFPMDMEGRLFTKQGQGIVQNSKIGGFAEHTISHQSQMVKLPKDMPLDRAALLACGVITGFGAVVYRIKVKPLSSVVVIGTGGVGLNTIQGAAFVGAYPVIAVDILDNKLDTARIFGATHTVNAKRDDAIEAVKKLTSGRGADYVFVTGGGASTVNQGYAMAGKRGTLVLIALPSGKDTPVYPFLPEFIGTEKTIVGSFFGSANLKVDIPNLVALYQAGRLKLDELISGRYPLEKINEAIEAVEQGKALRNVIVFKT
jgi:S-(hydroxymethyl)glutathione dehydrogenase / alcohol dehydrogenase